jgi:hypothetical protein
VSEIPGKSAGEPLTRPIVPRFQGLFQDLRRDNLGLLDGIYDQNLLFEDPLHRIEGLPALKAYFTRLYDGVEAIRFEFGDVLEGPGQAMLTWTMHMRHRRFRAGESLALPGASHIRFSDRVHYHRDYFDVGALVYERLPVLGSLIRAVRARV